MKAQEIQIANQANFKSNQPSKITSEQKAPEQKENGKKLLALGAAAVAAITVAGIAIYKGKGKQVVQEVQEDVNKAADNAKNAMQETIQELGDDVSKAGEESEFTNILEITVKVPSEAIQEVIPETEKTAGQVTRKLSGNADERLAALESHRSYANTVNDMTPEELEVFKKLKPEILEQIGDEGLFYYLHGDIEGITTTLNGISSETLKALNDIGISTNHIISKLATVSIEPITGTTTLGCSNPKTQFIRIKLLDEIFTPEGIKSLTGLDNWEHDWSRGRLMDWLLGHSSADKPFDIDDAKFLLDDNFALNGILKDEYKDENAILELAKKIEESL